MAIRGAILDALSLGSDIDLSPLAEVVDTLDVYNVTSADQVAERLQDVAVVFSNKVQIDRFLLEHCPALRLICVLATGTNNIDLDAAAEKGIPVTNAVAYGTDSVAQHSLMLMLMLATQQTRYARRVAAGEWSQSPFFCMMDYPVITLKNKHLVIVGEGNLGQAVAGLAANVGMRVTFCARPGNEHNDSRTPLKTLLPEADFVSLHCPLTESTQNLLDAQLLKNAKKELNIVNCARGGIVNECDVLQALRAGRVRGYATDVLSKEPPEVDHPLITAMTEDLNLVVTPHNAWISQDARQNIVNQAAAAVRTHL